MPKAKRWADIHPTSDRESWRGWYKLARWRRLRSAQLSAQPCCSLCLAEGKVEAATVVHHVKAHKGNPDRFFDPLNLASICKPHHDRDLQSEERGGQGWTPEPVEDGWPTYRPHGKVSGSLEVMTTNKRA